MRPTGRIALTHFVLFGVLTVSAISQSFIYAVLPPLGREMQLSDVQIGSIATLAALVFVVSAPWLGGLSEHYGRVPFILAGLIAAIVCNALYAVVIDARLAGIISSLATYVALVASRIGLNICWAGMFPAAQAYVADTTQVDQRTSRIAAMWAAFGIGTVSGPAIAWGFSHISLLAPFYCVAILTCVALAAAWILVPEPPPRAQEAPRLGGDYGLGALARFLVIAALITTCAGLLQQLAAFRIQDLFALTAEQATRWAGTALTAMAMSMLATQGLIISLGWNARRLLRSGSVLGVVGMSLIAATDSYALQVVAMGLFGAGFGMIMAGNAAAITLVADPNAQGRVAGFSMAALGLGNVLGPILGTSIYQWNQIAPFGLATALLVLLAILAFGAQVPMAPDQSKPQAS